MSTQWLELCVSALPMLKQNHLISNHSHEVASSLMSNSSKLIWALNSYRAGESAQVSALSEVLSERPGWKQSSIQLRYLRRGVGLNLFRGVGFGGIDLRASDALEPPWPDLLVCSGLRNEPVARQIRANSKARTKIVVLGRTWANYDCFDLIVTTPQYRLPKRPNILHNLTTLHNYSAAKFRQSAPAARALWPDLPEPYLVVLLGGRSGPFTFGAHAARRLAGMVHEMATQLHATVLIATSARTETRAAEFFVSLLKVPHRFHRYTRDCSENPYASMLAVASAIIVTGDSIAMLSEAVATDMPVYIFDLGAGKRTMRRRYQPGSIDKNLYTEAYRCLMAFGPQRLSRDIGLVHHRLVAAGLAAWLDEAGLAQAGDRLASRPEQSALERTVERVHRLFEA